MKVLFTRPLTAPLEQPVPANFVLLEDESQLIQRFEARFRFSKRWASVLMRLWLAWRLLRERRRYDAIAVGRCGEFFAPLQALWPFGRKPLVLLDIEWRDIHQTPLRRAVNRALKQLTVRGADRLGVFCEAEAGRYAERFRVDAGKFQWIPYCEDPPVLPSGVPSENYLFTSGVHQRDYATLFAAIEGLNVELRVVAPASGFAQMRVPSNVRFLGYLNRPQYWRTLAAARMVVMSIDAGVLRRSGVITYVGALRLGKCLVINDPVGAVSYFKPGVSGFVVPPQDPASLRRQIAELLNLPEKAAAAGASAREFSKRYAADRYYGWIQEALDLAVANRHSR